MHFSDDGCDAALTQLDPNTCFGDPDPEPIAQFSIDDFLKKAVFANSAGSALWCLTAGP